MPPSKVTDAGMSSSNKPPLTPPSSDNDTDDFSPSSMLTLTVKIDSPDMDDIPYPVEIRLETDGFGAFAGVSGTVDPSNLSKLSSTALALGGSYDSIDDDAITDDSDDEMPPLVASGSSELSDPVSANISDPEGSSDVEFENVEFETGLQSPIIISSSSVIPSESDWPSSESDPDDEEETTSNSTFKLVYTPNKCTESPLAPLLLLRIPCVNGSQSGAIHFHPLFSWSAMAVPPSNLRSAISLRETSGRQTTLCSSHFLPGIPSRLFPLTMYEVLNAVYSKLEIVYSPWELGAGPQDGWYAEWCGEQVHYAGLTLQDYLDDAREKNLAVAVFGLRSTEGCDWVEDIGFGGMEEWMVAREGRRMRDNWVEDPDSVVWLRTGVMGG
ncbi:hypothetical protein BZA05DRAFT_410954 [Tricharina praecox]|uniref:uncharacterized protein n=1 Tax=Tricharina praecox TaxID=43433 RepID=UPI00221FE7EE|nr:uncharacterized protein BZA05DRAFT_410954 [Tricharina praecox]KAI5843233.1 hypothetical protein BZA05DRAFT_410954 [Tricharina praecox]